MRQNQAIFYLVNISRELQTEIRNNLPENTMVREAQNLNLQLHQNSKDSSVDILFMSPEQWQDLDQALKDDVEAQDRQLVLVLEQDQEYPDQDLPGSFLGYLRSPLTYGALKNIRDKAVEVKQLYSDLYMMAKEIALERELLARKNTQLEFLNRILGEVSQTLDLEEILQIANREFASLLDTKGLTAIFWDQVQENLQAEIYIPKGMNPKLSRKWMEYLLEVMQRFEGQTPEHYHSLALSSEDNKLSQHPNPHRQILLPLQYREKTFGALVLVGEKILSLGKDQRQIIDSASQHLALSIRNALKYKAVKHEADFDGLTSIHNRQHFDKKLRQELKRHQRLGHSLSLIMLDLDHFKQLNDSYGHVTGDMVLKKIGDILAETVRETDFPARYGGEEFVVILPETTEEQAWFLAQRLRIKISQTVFTYEDKKFSITASLGVASMTPGPLTPEEKLLKQADQALYFSKVSGRNMVCTSAETCMEKLASN